MPGRLRGLAILALASWSPCVLLAATSDEGRPNEDVLVVLKRLGSTFENLRTLYVEYDLYVIEADGRAAHKTSVIEASGEDRYFRRVIHWYYQFGQEGGALYNFDGRAELDPLLNWTIWTPHETRQLWETRREGIVYRSKPITLPIPFVVHFTEHLGRPLARRAAGLDHLDEVPVRYSAREYYFPWALEQPGWRLAETDAPTDTGETLLERVGTDTIDTLTVVPRLKHAIIDREIRSNDGSFYFRISGDDFVQAAPEMWLPKTLRVKSNEPYTIIMRAQNLVANHLPESIFDQEFPPGTLVDDRVNGKRFQVPGGEDLLDFTIERMGITMRSLHGSMELGATRATIRNSIIVLLILAALCLCVTASWRWRAWRARCLRGCEAYTYRQRIR